MKNIILGITGSIAAYKAADLANQLSKEGHNVTVLMTESATKFITPLTLQSVALDIHQYYFPVRLDQV